MNVKDWEIENSIEQNKNEAFVSQSRRNALESATLGIAVKTAIWCL